MKLDRIIGEYSSGQHGSLLFITVGVHGNEPSGLLSLREIFAELTLSRPNIKGTVVGVAGNLNGLRKGVRFIDEDLNRTWKAENIENNLRDSHEKEEMHEIIATLENYPPNKFTERYFLDCHTTSSASLPYISVQDKGSNDRWAHRFPVYIIRGFSDIVSGTIDDYLSKQGLTGFVFEGGQHEAAEAVTHQKAIQWLALKEACGLDFNDLSEVPQSVEFLRNKEAQKTFEIAYRHGLEPNDDFSMEPGYENFQSIKKGELLAHHNGQPITSQWNAQIFMPLYQAQGNDGFFVVKEV
ncbi:MAG: succinylglutamate desuccinylase [Flavobacteriaceae bacterium]|nr:succinylglutamate desuccinylase [Flavobacteriaceae bacterium]